MMATSYEGFYNGGVSSFNPDYGNFTGYRMSASQLGFPGSPQTANQLGETINAIKQGVKAFEVTALIPDTAETIPEEHFKEMRALMKLSGVKPSIHGPLIDAAGFGEKGWGGEEGRVDNERRMFAAIEKAHVLSPNESIPIVFHSANGAPGSEWRPGDKGLGEDRFVLEKGVVINKESGQAHNVKREYKFRPGIPDSLTKSVIGFDKKGNAVIQKGGPKGVLFSAEDSVGSVNATEWENKLTDVAQMSKHAEELIGAAPLNLGEYKDAVVTNKGIFKSDDNGNITGDRLPEFDKGGVQENSYNQMKKASLFLENAELVFKGAFHQAYKYGTDEQRKKLQKLSESYSSGLNKASDRLLNPVIRHELLDGALSGLREITKNKTPKIFQMSEEFAVDKASETFGNLAMKSYDKFGKNAPTIAIENLFQGFAFSRANELKDLVDKSRDNFVKQLVEEKGFSKSQARDIAKKQIGVTWDVGHLNILKKKGFTDKDLVEQTKIITKDKSMVKHVHLTDNFGFADTHLPPGMGNVPIKKIMEQLEKTGRLGDMRKIVEAGGFVQHFKNSPHPLSLTAFGSPIYGMKASPYFNQVHQIVGSYSGGYGTLNPQTHHSYFGAGFTTMPVELGGQMPGGQSRFGGTPMS